MSPAEKLRAMIILVHGVGEHIRRYEGWAGLFTEAMIGVAGVDLPGHGRSDGKRGHIRSYGITDDMIDILLRECRKTFPGIPLFLYGHSMGGGVVLAYLIRKNPDVSGAIVTSPWLKLTFEPARMKVRLASIMKNIMPSFVQSSGLVVEHISRDAVVVEQYRKDPLVHGLISVALFHSAMSAASGTLKNASGLKKLLLLMHGTGDQICSHEGSREFAEKTPLAELKLWEGAYHELHNESCRQEVFDTIRSWIDDKLS
ncbi:MAG: lysophospholipase [Bacteroidales bacterium]|nr:lysophospholipase [Bacteroidales bacterium]